MLGPMATWLGSLLRGDDFGTDVALVTGILGAEGLARLRAWIAEQPDDLVVREKVGAIHACIWMVQADRETHPSEVQALQDVIAKSELPWGEQTKLLAALNQPMTPETIAADLSNPQLRELMLAVAWEMARADGRVDEGEISAYEELAAAFGVTLARSEEIRAAVGELPD